MLAMLEREELMIASPRNLTLTKVGKALNPYLIGDLFCPARPYVCDPNFAAVFISLLFMLHKYSSQS